MCGYFFDSYLVSFSRRTVLASEAFYGSGSLLAALSLILPRPHICALEHLYTCPSQFHSRLSRRPSFARKRTEVAELVSFGERYLANHFFIVSPCPVRQAIVHSICARGLRARFEVRSQQTSVESWQLLRSYGKHGRKTQHIDRRRLTRSPARTPEP